MTAWILSSCVLMGIILLARLVLKKKLRPELRYGLWLLVLVRLLLPVSLFDSSMSVLNALPDTEISDEPAIYLDYTLPQTQVQSPSQPVDVPVVDVPPVVTAPVQQAPQPTLSGDTPVITPPVQQAPIQVPVEPEPTGTPISWGQILLAVWIGGMCLSGGILLGSNLHFTARLRRSRIRETVEGYPLRVYTTPCVVTPCLLGGTVYLPPDMTDPTMRAHALIHELCHYRHGDHIWAVLRSLCLVIHWYNPLVWVCAVLSRRDGEVACDEAAIRRLGEDQRTAYGRTLIGMTCVRREVSGLMLTATTMVSGKRTLKERITCIARKPKTALLALFVLILVIAAAVGCTFTGTAKDAPAANDPPVYKDGGVQACLVRIDGELYVWEYFEETMIDPERLSTDYELVGTVQSEWRWRIPKKDLAACRLDVGTKLYCYTDPDTSRQTVYCYPSPRGNVGKLRLVDSIPIAERWWKQDKQSLQTYEKLICFNDTLYRFTGQTAIRPETIETRIRTNSTLYTGFPTANNSGTHFSCSITKVSDDNQTLHVTLSKSNAANSLLIYEKTTQEAVFAKPAIPMSVLRDTYLKSPGSPNWRALEKYYYCDSEDGTVRAYPIADEYFVLEVRQDASGKKQYALYSLLTGGRLSLTAENRDAFEVFTIPITRTITKESIHTILAEKGNNLTFADFAPFYHTEYESDFIVRKYKVNGSFLLNLYGTYDQITRAEFYESTVPETRIDILTDDFSAYLAEAHASYVKAIYYSHNDLYEDRELVRDTIYANAQGKLLFIFGELYMPAVWPVEITLPEYTHRYSVTKLEPNQIPTTEFASNYFPVGTQIYLRSNSTETLYLQEPGSNEVILLQPLLNDRTMTRASFSELPITSVFPAAMTMEDLCRFVREYDDKGTVGSIFDYRYTAMDRGDCLMTYDYIFDIADAPYCLKASSENLSQVISMRDGKDYDLLDRSGRLQFLMDWEDTQALTLAGLDPYTKTSLIKLSWKHSMNSGKMQTPFLQNTSSSIKPCLREM